MKHSLKVLFFLLFLTSGCAKNEAQGTDTGNAAEPLYAANELTNILCNRLIECGANMTTASCHAFSFAVAGAPVQYGLSNAYSSLTMNDVYNQEVAKSLSFNLSNLLTCENQMASSNCSAVASFISDSPNFSASKYISILANLNACRFVY